MNWLLRAIASLLGAILILPGLCALVVLPIGLLDPHSRQGMFSVQTLLPVLLMLGLGWIGWKLTKFGRSGKPRDERNSKTFAGRFGLSIVALAIVLFQTVSPWLKAGLGKVGSFFTDAPDLSAESTFAILAVLIGAVLIALAAYKAIRENRRPDR